MKRLKSLPKVNPKRKKPVLQRRTKTKAIDPAKGPTKSKLNKGAAEPMDTKTRVPVRLSKMRKINPKKPSSGPGGGQSTAPQPSKRPGISKGGSMVKKSKGGSMMKKSKGGKVMYKSKGGSIISGNANRRRAARK